FVSLDSPHKGAVIPLAVQSFLYFWAPYSPAVAEQLTCLNWASAKELLIGRHDELYHATFPTADFLAFQTLYQSFVPHNARMVAMSNGSGGGNEQSTSYDDQVQFYF